MITAAHPSTTTVRTLPEIAELLHVSPATIYRLAEQGRIPAYRVGGQWRFDEHAVLDHFAHRAA